MFIPIHYSVDTCTIHVFFTHTSKQCCKECLGRSEVKESQPQTILSTPSFDWHCKPAWSAWGVGNYSLSPKMNFNTLSPYNLSSCNMSFYRDLGELLKLLNLHNGTILLVDINMDWPDKGSKINTQNDHTKI